MLLLVCFFFHQSVHPSDRPSIRQTNLPSVRPTPHPSGSPSIRQTDLPSVRPIYSYIGAQTNYHFFFYLQQIEYTLHRDTKGLGINIAGGKGSTPYKENDEVSHDYSSLSAVNTLIRCFIHAFLISFPPQSIFISKISENGPAGKDDILKVGDRILKVSYFPYSSV